MAGIHYVYRLTEAGLVRYVGMGKGRRVRRSRKLRGVDDFALVAEGLTRRQALDLERQLIADLKAIGQADLNAAPVPSEVLAGWAKRAAPRGPDRRKRRSRKAADRARKLAKAGASSPPADAAGPRKKSDDTATITANFTRPTDVPKMGGLHF